MSGQFPPYPGDLECLDRYRSDRRPFFMVRADPPPAIVLGCGTPAAPDVDLDNCRADAVPVYRRRGGGGAVVLGPGVVVVSGCFPKVEGRWPDEWSARLVAVVGTALAAAARPEPASAGSGPRPELVSRGLGDLCLAPAGDEPERKILGSSLYLPKDAVLYQASLLYRADLSLITRYLGPPSREPAYRRGRAHADFVANLPWALDLACLEARLNAAIPSLLGS
ncbi:MAG: lipoyl protein ligase domain-containing protein [Chitinophagales bacterium]